ncbi:uncharacterized protein K02A2.6-like isoform X1 [Stomoxys calcitrans]|uniref:uncharacterized protein K02A2.6-like isoform X1 n=3 Tax=Stomoxys calcitrans TaxID=35570 RepID=UPI0027E3A0CE|nr:uncharacterized protein K02A2.6-like isoform X1 [Stomoxys calcitrans]
MSADMDKLLQAITSMTNALQEQQQQQQQLQQSNITSVNVISNFDQFDPKTESFDVYKERLENYLQLKGVFGNKEMCAKLLLQYVGASNYSTLATLVAPTPINQLSYDNIIFHLKQHFCPKKNILVQQHKFLNEIQNEDQSISDFIAVLQEKAAMCHFVCSCNKSVSDIFCRAQFIRGIRDNSIREKLLQKPEDTFVQICEKAKALEAAKINNNEIMQSSSTSEVNKIKQKQSATSTRYQKSNRYASSSSTVNYRQLGLEGMCLRCGRNNHRSNECKINKNNLKCSFCNKTGHVRQVCIKSKFKQNSSYNAIQSCSSDDDYCEDDDNFGIHQIVDIYNKSEIPPPELQKFFATVSIDGRKQVFEVDSGAGYTLIPKNDFEKLKLNLKLQKTKIAFRAYTGDVFIPLGVVDVNVQYKNRKSREKMFVVDARHSALLGRVWIRHLKIDLREVDQDCLKVNTDNNVCINSISEITQKFSKVFQQKVGCIPNLICSLKLQEGAKPAFLKERQVPFALREKVEQELDTLENEGIISKVNTSNWGSPLVVIPKPDGNVRLCVDYKLCVNPQLEPAHYPIKRIDEIFNTLKNSKYFCKLDLYKAYLHVAVDDESKIIQTISTHRGTYRMNRLSFGIKTAPSEFNRIIDQILRGLEGTTSYFDDIIVHGPTKSLCEQRLIECLERLQTYNLHVNKDKFTGNPPQKEPQIEEVIIQRNQTQPQAPSESQPPASAEPQLPETPLSIRRSNRVRRLPARFQDHVPY